MSVPNLPDFYPKSFIQTAFPQIPRPTGEISGLSGMLVSGATTTQALNMYIGQALPRDEDRRFLTGRGEYTDDICPAGCAHAVFVRSPHARARIVSISFETAASMPGVLCVLSADEWEHHGLGRLIPCITSVPFDDGRPMNEVNRPIFAKGMVQHVGDTVAAVVANTLSQAMDAAEAVDIDYQELPSVVDVVAALHRDAPILHQHLGTNIVHEVSTGDRQATTTAFEQATHVTELVMRNTRVTGSPMEPRACVGEYDSRRESYTLYASTQFPHAISRWLAEETLRISMRKVRVVAPDVGGGFGTKGYLYMEYAVVLWAARLTGRAVRFTATRSDAIANDTHARDHHTKARMAFDAEGHVLGIEVETLAGFGAYQNQFNAFLPSQYYPLVMTGLYRTSAMHVKVTGVYTNTSPIDAYRGGTQSATSVRERLIENGALELGIDSQELRTRNYLQASDYPHQLPSGAVYDSGDPPGQHAIMLSLADYKGLREEQRCLQAAGVCMGLGFSGFAEAGGHGPSRQAADQIASKMGWWEGARVQIHADGQATLFVGTHSHGQSHDVTFRQIAADELGISMQNIELLQGDSARDPGNLGTAAARSLSTTGLGIVQASRRIISQAKRLAAHLMECALDDVVYSDGKFSIAGTDRSLTFKEIARVSFSAASYPDDEDFDLGLDVKVHFDPVDLNYPTALHLAVVIVDTETGVVTLRDFFAVDDCGRVINPMVVHGQVHGGLAQGIGQALHEQIVYEEGSGQLLSGSFMDYCLPRADDLPSFSVEFQCTPNPNNVLGIKGCSESGTCGPPSAIGNAIVDALWDKGIRHIDHPFTPWRVWQALRNHRS